MRDLPGAVLTYIGITCLAGGVAMVVAAGSVTGLDPVIATAGIAALVAAAYTIPIPGTGVRLNADTPFVLAVIALGAPGVAILVAAGAQLVANVAAGTFRNRPYTLPFNAAVGVLGTSAASLTFQGTASLVAPAPLLLAALVLFGTSTGIIVGVVRIASGAFPGRDWVSGLPMHVAAYMASAGMASALAAVPSALTVVLVAGPLALVMGHAYAAQRDRTVAQQERHREREEVFLPSLEALVAALEARDERTHGHNSRVQSYALGFAHAIGIRDSETLMILRYGAMLHDVGRIAIPDAILHSSTALNGEELARMREHTVIGAELIRHIPFPEGVLDIVRHHHERFDGSGYPDHLEGHQISRLASMVALCDTFDSLRTGGGWRPPRTLDEALEVILSEAGSAFEPELAAAFVAWQQTTGEDAHQITPLSPASRAIRDTSREQAEHSALAYSDELTGLSNSRTLHRDLRLLCESNEPFGVLMMDLDGFKGINDHLGHDVGDRALQRVGAALRSLETPERRFYRNGGDEFIVLVVGELENQAETVRDAVEAEHIPLTDGGAVPLKTSVGLARICGGEVVDALREADKAMYAIKEMRKRRNPQPRGAPPTIVYLSP